MALIMFAVMLVLLFLGLPVSVALLIMVLFGFVVFVDPALGVNHVINGFFSSIAKFTLTPVPLFILVGNLMFHSGVAMRSINCISKWMGSIPARLSFISVAAGTFFGAISGSTLASFSLLASILYPEMRRQNYSKAMSIGPILASGGLAMIIPPSALSVFYAAIAQISVAGILIGGIGPGILMAVGYSSVILLRVAINPSQAPKYEFEKISWRERFHSLAVDLLPAAFVTGLMLVFILFGITTPTEAAAVGFVASLIVVIGYRNLTWDVIKKTVTSTMETTGMIFFITITAASYSQLLAHTGISTGMVKWVIGLGLTPIVTVIAMLILVVILGTFMDQVPIMMVTIPFFLPIIEAFGYNMIWFAVMMLIALQIGMTTPPFGLGLFVVKGVIPEIKVKELYAAAFPYLLSDAAVITLLLLLPDIVLYIPGVMNLI
ncbi:MAG: TRAP transporter large permease subunit [Bacillota bacterium]|nr:TRAP transporter large permease subunit [Bacillota bacterium]